jgi:hypothetical protein
MGIVWSADGTSWTPATGTTAAASAVAYSPALNRWVYVGSGTIRTSTDGKNWAATNYARGSQILWDVKWTKDRFLAAGQSSNVADANALQTDTLLQSADGLTWTPAITSAANAFSAAYSGGALTVTYGQQVTQTSTIVSTISTLGGSPAIKLSTDPSGTILYLNNSSITQSYALSATLASTTTALQTELRTGLTSTATYVDTRVSTVVASAPAILDTLSEIATALGNDPGAVVNLTSSIQASNDFISTTKSELRSTIDYVTTTNTTSLQTHGIQSYSATPLIHRRKYTGPYAPSTFSTLYSAAAKNPYEHVTNQGAAVILQPTTADQITTLPPYSTTWLRLGTIDLTTTGSNAAYTLSNLPSSYTGPSIPYYDVYIQPKTFYGSNTEYGFVKGTTASPAKQVHQAHIITYTSNTPYSAISLGGPWSAIYKDDIPELERLVKITNGNTIGVNSTNLFISAGSVVYEIAPGESTPFLYTNAGWSMVGDM